MADKSIEIPEEFNEYYEVSNLDIFVSSDIASKKEAKEVESQAINVLKKHNYEFLGWALAKNEYFEQLASSGLGFVCIAKDTNNEIKLINVIGQNIQMVNINE